MKQTKKQAHVIILAAGKGKRVKNRVDKMLIEVASKPLIYYSIMTYNDHPEIETITLVVNKENQKAINEMVKKFRLSKVKRLVQGGENRFESFKKGFSSVKKHAGKNDIIFVHNGANPLVSEKEIDICLKEMNENNAVVTGHFAVSTVKEVKKGYIQKTHDRKRIFNAQTPQVSLTRVFDKALKNANSIKNTPTDESMLLEAINQKIKIIKADTNNFKVTSPEDIKRLKTILGELPKDFLVGIGQDSHKFEKKLKGMNFGGLFLENEYKLKANSDGDVVLHSISNALSQAIGGGSLGLYADKMCEKGVNDSKKYLLKILRKVHKKGYRINNLGLMIECAIPKIDEISGQMKRTLSKTLGIESKQIGITATSGEEISDFGKGLGVQCFSIVSLVRRPTENIKKQINTSQRKS